MFKKVKTLLSANNKEKDNRKNKNNGEKTISKTKNGDDDNRLETDAAPVYPNEEDSFDNNLVPYNNNVTPTASADMTQQAIQELTTQPSRSLELVQNNNMSVINAPVPAVHNVNNPQNCTVYQMSNLSGVHLGNVFNISNSSANNYSSTSNPSCQNICQDGDENQLKCDKMNKPKNLKTRSVVYMMLSEEEPNHRLLDTVSRHLGATWKEVMRDLGRSDGEIEQSIIDNKDHGGTKEVIYQLLRKWIENADDGKGTVGVLTTLLWNTQHYDVVQKMKIEWKKQQRENQT